MGWPFSAYGFGKFLGGSQPGFPGFGNLLGDSWTGFFLLLFFVSLLLFLFLLLFLPLSFFGDLKKKFKMFWLKISELYKKCSSFQKIILKLEKRFVYSTFVPVLNNVRNIFVPNFKKNQNLEKCSFFQKKF